MTKTMKVIQKTLRMLRMRSNLTYDELVKKSGLSKGYLWQLENDKEINPSIEVLEKLAKVYGVKIGDLFEGMVGDV